MSAASRLSRSLGPLLCGRALADLHLTVWPRSDAWSDAEDLGGIPLTGVAAALRGGAALPAALAIENVQLAEAEWAALAAPPRVDAAALTSLALSPRRAPAAVLASLGPAPSLTTLWVQLDLGLLLPPAPPHEVHHAALAVTPWAGLPALRHLTLQIEWLTAYDARTMTDVAAAWQSTPVAWAVASVDATAETRASLASLTVIARGAVAADAITAAAYGPAGGWPSLRAVRLRVEPSGWGGSPSSDEEWDARGGWAAPRTPPSAQARLRRALRRLLPSRVALHVAFDAPPPLSS